MNNVTLIGRLCADPELRRTQNGTAVASVTLAVDRMKKEDGADFVPLVIWKGTAEAVARYCKKGDRLGVAGRLQVRNYTAQDGSKRTATEVVADKVEFLTPKGEKSEKPTEGYTEMTEPDGSLPF